jgi:hypothetical protein
LMVNWLLKKFPTFHEVCRFTTSFTKTPHSILA